MHPKCRYTKSHEWVRVEGDYGYVGITDYAQQQLSDIVYVEMPEWATAFAKGRSVSARSSRSRRPPIVFLPVAGEIVEINEELDASPPTW